jgi:hypothetical protein
MNDREHHAAIRAEGAIPEVPRGAPRRAMRHPVVRWSTKRSRPRLITISWTGVAAGSQR